MHIIDAITQTFAARNEPSPLDPVTDYLSSVQYAQFKKKVNKFRASADFKPYMEVVSKAIDKASKKGRHFAIIPYPNPDKLYIHDEPFVIKLRAYLDELRDLGYYVVDEQDDTKKRKTQLLVVWVFDVIHEFDI